MSRTSAALSCPVGVLLLVGVLSSSILSPVQGFAASKDKRFTLLFTSALRGWVEPCGCTMEPLGGVDRVKAAVDQVAARGPVLFVDGGDLLFDKEDVSGLSPCTEEARVKLLMTAARAEGLQLTGLGPLDLSRGDAFRHAALKDGGIQALAANVEGAAGVQRSTVKDVGGVKVGLVGITWPPGTVVGPQPAAWKGLTLHPPQPALAREVEQLKKQGARVVVLLAQASRTDLQSWVQTIKGIDFIILGHEPGEKPRSAEALVAGTWLVSAGNQGMFVGRLDITLEGDGLINQDDKGRVDPQEVDRLEERIRQLEEQAREAENQGNLASAGARRTKAQELRVRLDGMRATKGPARVLHGNRFTFDSIRLDEKSPLDVPLSRKFSAYKNSLPGIEAKCPAGKARQGGAP